PTPASGSALVHPVIPSADCPDWRRNIPLSGGTLRGDQLLDPSPSPGKLLFRLPVVSRHAPQEIRLRLLRVHPTHVLLAPHRMTVRALVVPEVEVPPAVEIPNPRTAADLHRLYL